MILEASPVRLDGFVPEIEIHLRHSVHLTNREPSSFNLTDKIKYKPVRAAEPHTGELHQSPKIRVYSTSESIFVQKSIKRIFFIKNDHRQNGPFSQSFEPWMNNEWLFSGQAKTI